MNRSIFLLIASLIFIGTAAAQQNPNMKAAADSMATATVKGDYYTLVKYIYPKFTAKTGGKDSLFKRIKSAFENLKNQGITLKDAKIGHPGEVKLIGNKQFCVLSQQIFLDMNGKVFTSTSSVLGISENKGRQWYFIALQDNGNPEVDEFFPELKGSLTFPKSTRPVEVNN
jgi:hypothetical protein